METSNGANRKQGYCLLSYHCHIPVRHILTYMCSGPRELAMPAQNPRSHGAMPLPMGIFNEGASLRGLSSTILPRQFMTAISTFSCNSRRKWHVCQVASLKSPLGTRTSPGRRPRVWRVIGNQRELPTAVFSMPRCVLHCAH